jgi:hypothetical protein
MSMEFIPYFEPLYDLGRLRAVRCEESFPRAEFSHPDCQMCYCKMHNLHYRITAQASLVFVLDGSILKCIQACMVS